MLDNINPSLWGESFWTVGHYITIAYPNNPSSDDKKNVYNFFISLQHLLPCEKCRIHYIENLRNYPLTDDILENKKKIMDWFLNMHNIVNKQTHKSVFTMNDFAKRYLTLKRKSKIKYIIMLIILVILLYIIYKC